MPWGYHGDIFGVSFGYLGDIFGISLGHLWDIFGISWGYLGDILGISSGYLGDSFVGAYLRSSSGHFLSSLHIIALNCSNLQVCNSQPGVCAGFHEVDIVSYHHKSIVDHFLRALLNSLVDLIMRMIIIINIIIIIIARRPTLTWLIS